MTANASHLQAYLKTWDKYRDIWEKNKDSFIQRYQRRNLPLSSFDADIQRCCEVLTSRLTSFCYVCIFFPCYFFVNLLTSRYSEEANSVQQEETIINVQFVMLDCSLLKASLVQHYNEWQTKFTQLLSNMASMRLKELHTSLHDSANR